MKQRKDPLYKREGNQYPRIDWCFAYDTANYYIWLCNKGKQPTLPGNNPLTGGPRDKGKFSTLGQHHINEGKIAYKALAKYWLSVARSLR